MKKLAQQYSDWLAMQECWIGFIDMACAVFVLLVIFLTMGSLGA